MENSMYYTFSTIAQVLAAFISLSGVFIIFKLQDFKKIQLQHVHNFINQLDTQSEFLATNHVYKCIDIATDLVNLHRAECLDGMQDQMAKIISSPAAKSLEVLEDLQRIHKVYPILDKKRVNIICLAKTSTIIGAATIFYSIIVLTKIPDWKSNYQSLFIIGIVPTLLCIVIMLISIFKALTEHKSTNILLK